MSTEATMQKINEVNDLLITAKNRLIDAVNQAETMEEKIGIAKAQACVQAAIKVILKTFYPKEPFDEAKWFKRRTVKDIEHDQRVQKILDDAVATGAYDGKEWLANVTVENLAKLGKCDHDCKDCDQRHVVGDEEYCLQGEEMK